MKSKPEKRGANPAARALREAEFRQRIVKAKKNSAYTRKEKHKKREGQSEEPSLFIYVDQGCGLAGNL